MSRNMKTESPILATSLDSEFPMATHLGPDRPGDLPAKCSEEVGLLKNPGGDGGDQTPSWRWSGVRWSDFCARPEALKDREGCPLTLCLSWEGEPLILPRATSNELTPQSTYINNCVLSNREPPHQRVVACCGLFSFFQRVFGMHIHMMIHSCKARKQHTPTNTPHRNRTRPCFRRNVLCPGPNFHV